MSEPASDDAGGEHNEVAVSRSRPPWLEGGPDCWRRRGQDKLTRNDREPWLEADGVDEVHDQHEQDDALRRAGTMRGGVA